jgi:hypothetical protein
VPQSQPIGVLPLRPLTFGELLDAAVLLLRGNARVFLLMAAVLAAGEQALLYPLRIAAGIRPPFGTPYADRLGEYWLMLGVSLGTEVFIIAVVGGLTARAAGPALRGERLSSRELLDPAGGRFLAVLGVALVVGFIATVAALAGLLPWVFAYGLLGLAVPAVVIDRVNPGRALLRSIGLSGRAGMRAGWIRLGGYLGWYFVRLALNLGGLALVRLFLADVHQSWVMYLQIGALAAVNAVAYAMLASLDAVLHLETRMRCEGLDIALSRARHRGRPMELAVR